MTPSQKNTSLETTRDPGGSPEAGSSEEPAATRSGLTVRSVAASVVVTFASGIIGAVAGVFDNANNLIGIEALAVPAMLIAVPLIFVCAAVAGVARSKLLSRAELVVVLFAALIATPLMTVGFWRYQLSGLSTIVRASDWTKFEALSEGLWPHGPNVLEGVLAKPGALAVSGPTPHAARVRDGVLSLSNTASDQVATGRVRLSLGPEQIPFREGSRAGVVPGRPYLLTALVHAKDLGPNSTYFVRLYADSEPAFASEPISGRAEAKASALLPDGFRRVGLYPLALPDSAKTSVVVELGLRGSGGVRFRDLRLYDVRAIESAYKGYRRVTAEEYPRLSLAERQTVVVVPDSLLSRAGANYLLGLSYPILDFKGPVLRLGAFALLTFLATLGIALIFRRQWLKNERFPLPMGRVILTLLGADESEGGLGQRFWKNRWLWVGFGVTFVWCFFKVIYGYYPSLPDLRISVSLKSYLADAFWGRTWDSVNFEVFALFLGLGLLMEQSVLSSLVLGFLAFRMQYWLGQAQGLSGDQDFPYFPQQMLGAYLAYTLTLVYLTRRYLGSAVRSLRLGALDLDASEKRTGVLLVAASLIGFLVWGPWAEVPLAGVALIVGHVLMLAFVAQKFRAECGLPYGGFNHPLGNSGNYSAPVEAMLLIPFFGGMAMFGGTSMIAMTLIWAAVLPFGFFNVPGLQVELLEVGRRFGVKTWHLMATALFGVVLAIVIGGFIYLTSAYGFGAAKFPVAEDFDDSIGAFRVFNSEYSAAQSALDAAATGGSAPPSQALSGGRLFAVGFGAVGAAAITLLRQIFPGFWFHPIGFLMGPSAMMQGASSFGGSLWGSLLVAYLIRLAVLRLGGAATVREKLVPAAIGIFLAALSGYALYIAGNAYWFFFSKGSVKFMGLL